jgi:DNA-binding MarR family transcriptional regulator
MREECTSFADKLAGLFSDIVVKSLTVQLLRELDELDLTLSQLQALTHVAERTRCPVGSIAEGLSVTHPAAVKLVDKLARKGLVARRQAPADHRQTEVSITEQGRNLVNHIRQERTQRLESVLDRMDREDRQALIHGLQAFVTTALRNDGALDAICTSCQTLRPTNCDDFLQMQDLAEDREPAPVETFASAAS